MVNFRAYGVADGVAVEGELDMATAPILHAAIQRSPAGSEIVLDLAGMTFVDSAGLAGLLSIVRSDRRVRLINPSRSALRVMVVAGVERELMNA